jgi:hypothetical protein
VIAVLRLDNEAFPAIGVTLSLEYRVARSASSSVDASACDESATSYWSCIGELGDDYEFMTWDYVASSGTWKHRATLSVSYQAGPSPYFGEFEVLMFGCCLDPIALLTVNYWQEQY